MKSDLKNKYPIIRYLTSFKFWGIVLGVALIIQVVFIVLLSYKAFVFFTGIIFWGILWYIAAFLFRHISPKWKLTLHSTFVVLMLLEVFLRLSGMVANYAEDRFGHYESFYSLTQHAEYYINPPSDANLVFDGNEFTFKRKTNNFGYFDKAWVWENMKEKTRILGLGDSFTAGDGTHKDSTWLNFFERKLNDTSFYFMNGGIIGSDPVFMAYNLKNTFSQFRPHHVIVCFNDTDISDIILRGGFERID